jgi:hypothetical protein
MLRSQGLATSALCLAMLAGCASTGIVTDRTTTGPTSAATTSASMTPIPRASTASARAVAPSDTLTVSGLGPLTMGMSRDELLASKAMIPADTCEGVLKESDALRAQGIRLAERAQGLGQISLVTSAHTTTSGARVGMTMKQIRTTYGGDLTKKTLTYGAASPRKVDVYVYVAQGNMIFFKADSERATDSDVVASIVLKKDDGYGIADDDAC